MAEIRSSKDNKSTFVFIITVFVLVIVGIIAYMAAKDILRETAGKSSKRYKVFIDSGHGGIDPGKIGVNGIYEKDVNLAISLLIKEKLIDADCDVVMTREDDTGLYDESDKNKKSTDLRRRVEMMNTEMPDVIVSIHQNSFTQASSKGAQVFYQTTSEEGKRFADIMQKQLITDLDKDNKRVAKSNSDYYILKNSTSVAIIIECGFLSNPQEADLLADKDYQDKVAESVSKGILNYLSGTENNNIE